MNLKFAVALLAGLLAFAPRSYATTTTTTLPNSCDNPTVITGNTYSGTGSTATGTGALVGRCAGGSAKEHVYTYTPDTTGVATFSTCPVETTTNFDTVVYLRTTCDDVSTELACNDDGQNLAYDPTSAACNTSGGAPVASRLSVPVTADQEYFLIVDGYGKYHGNYSLSVTFVTTTTTTTTLP